MSELARGSGSGIGRVIDVVSSVLIEAGILLMVGVWTVIWIFLGMKTAELQGTLHAVIIGVYTLLPVVGVLLWRLSVRTRWDLPGLTDFMGPAEVEAPEPETEKSEVAQRFETGE